MVADVGIEHKQQHEHYCVLRLDELHQDCATSGISTAFRSAGTRRFGISRRGSHAANCIPQSDLIGQRLTFCQCHSPGFLQARYSSR
jgi:hypothetical protein